MKKERDEEMLKRRQNQNKFELLPNSRVFKLNEHTEAKEYASQIGSYVDRAFNGYQEWVGYFIPV